MIMNQVKPDRSSNSKSLSLKSKLQFAAHSVISNIACRPDGTVNRRLLKLADIKSPPSNTPIDGVKSSDHTVDSFRDLWFRLFIPINAVQSSSSIPILIYFHGGGFVSFSPSTKPFNAFCRRLAGELNSVVISVNYRHSPEHRCPCQYDDGFDIVRYLDGERDKIENFPANADVRKCFLVGDNAGGNLAHHVAVRSGECYLKSVQIRGLIAIQPLFGGEERTESELRLKNGPRLNLERTDFYWKAFLPDGSDRDHPKVNVFGPKRKDISGSNFPATLVVVGGLDLLKDWQKRYCEGLRRFGKEVEMVEYPNVYHGFYVAPELPESSLLVGKVGEFMQKQLGLD